MDSFTVWVAGAASWIQTGASRFSPQKNGQSLGKLFPEFQTSHCQVPWTWLPASWTELWSPGLAWLELEFPCMFNCRVHQSLLVTMPFSSSVMSQRQNLNASIKQMSLRDFQNSQTLQSQTESAPLWNQILLAISGCQPCLLLDMLLYSDVPMTNM